MFKVKGINNVSSVNYLIYVIDVDRGKDGFWTYCVKYNYTTGKLVIGKLFSHNIFRVEKDSFVVSKIRKIAYNHALNVEKRPIKVILPLINDSNRAKEL